MDGGSYRTPIVAEQFPGRVTMVRALTSLLAFGNDSDRIRKKVRWFRSASGACIPPGNWKSSGGIDVMPPWKDRGVAGNWADRCRTNDSERQPPQTLILPTLMTPIAHKILKSAFILVTIAVALAAIWVSLQKQEATSETAAITLCGSGLIFCVILLLGIWRDKRPDE